MNKKSLIYGIAGLLVSGTFTGVFVVNRLQAQTQVSQQNTPPKVQQNPQDSEQNLHHPEGSPTTKPSGMNMMSQQQAEQHFIQMMIPHHQGVMDMAS